MPAAVRLLREACRVTAVSSVYESAPVGQPGQPYFFNAAVLIETRQDAAQFKTNVLSEVEQQLKRQRREDKNAPRTIDADIILFNDAVFDYTLADGSRRRVPDPDLLRYPHVAIPVAELAPAMLHPETAEPLAAIADRLVTAAGQLEQPPIRPRRDILLYP